MIHTLLSITAISFAMLSMLAAAESTVFATGSLNHAFTSWGNASLKGEWTIVKENDRYFIELSDDFFAKKGPDVKIFLSPTPSSNVTGDNAVAGSVFIQQIDQFKGKQRIAIPQHISVSEYASLVFHCEAYSKLWGVSPLKK